MGRRLLSITIAAVIGAVGALSAAPGAFAGVYYFCNGAKIEGGYTCGGARHTLIYIDVYYTTGTGPIEQFVKPGDGGCCPYGYVDGYGDVTSGSKWANNTKLLYPFGKNIDVGHSHYMNAYDFT